jgi:aspartate 4-decarboxylase
MIAMNEDNVVDRLIANLPAEHKDELAGEYAIVSSEPEAMPFVERLCADSRSIGLYHTSGLSTPSQVFMDLLALTHLIDPDNDPYIEQSKATVHERYVALMEALGLAPDTSRENAQYYTIVDINELMRQRYGDDFVAWRPEAVSDLTFLDDLAKKEGVVLMYGPGFDAPEGCVRVSLANLNKDDYVEIARRMGELMDEYYARFQQESSRAA